MISPVTASSTHQSQRDCFLLPTYDPISSTLRLTFKPLLAYKGLTRRLHYYFLSWALTVSRLTPKTRAVSRTPAPEYRLSDLLFDQVVTGLVSIRLHEGSAAVIASVALSTSASSTIAFDMLGLPTMFTGNCF